MHGHELGNIELQLLDRVEEAALVAGDPRGKRLECVHQVRLEEELLFRQIGNQHPFDVVERIHVVNLHRPHAVADHVVLPHGLEVVALGQLGGRPERHHVGPERPRHVIDHVAIEEVEVLPVRDDGGADVVVGAQPAGVVEVLMRVDDEANRFVRDQSDDLFDDRKAPASLSGAS